MQGYGFWCHNIDLDNTPVFEGCEYYACDAVNGFLLDNADHYWPTSLIETGPVVDVIGTQGIDQHGASYDDPIGTDIYDGGGCTPQGSWKNFASGANFGEQYLQWDTGDGNLLFRDGLSVGQGVAFGVVLRNALESGGAEVVAVINWNVYDTDGGSSVFEAGITNTEAQTQNLYGTAPTLHGLPNLDTEARPFLFTFQQIAGAGAYRFSIWDVLTETRISTKSSQLPSGIGKYLDTSSSLNNISLMSNFARIEFADMHLKYLDSMETDLPVYMAAFKTAFERNFTDYYAGDECYTEGCRPYYCGAFQQAIIAEQATVWPLDDMDFSETVPADGILRKLGTAPITQDYITDAASRGDSWDIAGTNPITTRTVSDNIGYCRDYFLYLAEPGAGAWISAVNEHPSNVDINGDTQTDIGAYMVREYSTGSVSFLVSEDYFVYTFLGAGNPRRADPMTVSINIDDETGAFIINMDGKNQAGSTAQDLTGGFWVHAKYSRTFGTISGSILPYDVRCDLYINGVLEGTLDQSTQRANIKNDESYGVAATYAANDVPGFATPSRLYVANDNIAVADLYTGTDMDMDVLKLGWDRNFTTYTVPEECN